MSLSVMKFYDTNSKMFHILQLARALTLRTLGWMSGVVGENRQVQHLIREALDAKESVELQAAIMAAEKYAAKSK